MLSSTTIEDVKNIDIVDVISNYIELKKKGANYVAPCPFHDEKSASFIVSPAKQIYKCFGCGCGGDSINFVTEHLKLDFIEAVKEIAGNHSIKVETLKGKTPTKKKTDPALHTINSAIRQLYNICITDKAATEYLTNRSISEDDISVWSIGYAPAGNRVADFAIKNDYIKQCIELGLIRTNDEGKTYYDFFRNRIIFPILDHQGNTSGFGARDIQPDPKVKYLNSLDSSVFNKSNLLYGLYQSLGSFRQTGYAVIVEGYTDVISMHAAGHTTTVATCGTALTDHHASLLKRYTSKVIILRDGDKAGQKATLRDIEILLSKELNVLVYPLPEGQDPDTFIKEGHKLHLNTEALDAMNYVASIHFTEDILGRPRKTSQAIKEVARYLSIIKDDTLRDQYIVEICHQVENFNLEPEAFTKVIDKSFEATLKQEKRKVERKFTIMDEERGLLTDRVPDDSIDQYYKYRFFERSKGLETGIWFPQQEGAEYVRLTNFVLIPLFHLKSPEKNVRLVEAIGYDQHLQQNFTNIIELQSSEMLTKTQFATKLFDVGPYLLDSKFTNNHLGRIHSKIAFEFKIANEITSLGWQDEGFWAFANKAFYGGALRDYDRFGIVEVGEEHFLSPSASEMHKDEKDSVYENDKMHSYVLSKETFKTWSAQIMKVFGDNGYALLGFGVMTIFVDIVKRFTEAPLWYPYGPKESGKSTLAKSLLALFFDDKFEPFNLGTASTDYAFFNRLERFNNCPAAYNEFDEFALKDEWFRAFKAVYDGEGRERGRGIRGKTHTQKVKSTVLIIGQYLSTKDDNSVLSRTIPCLVRPKAFTQKETEEYEKLRVMERAGLTSILLELLQYRDHFDNTFKKVFDETFASMRETLQKKRANFSGRILKNFATITAATITMMDKVKFPFSQNDYVNYALGKVEEISSTMSESNALSDFWKTIEYLVDRNQITDGWDFRIKSEVSVKVAKTRNESIDIPMKQPTKVLYIRMNTVFREYARVVGQITKGKGLNEQTLQTYLKEQNYYIGSNPGLSFRKVELDGTASRMVTSSLALNYEQLGISIERSFDEEEDNRKDEEFKAVIKVDAEKTPSGTQLEFRVEHTVAKTNSDTNSTSTEILFTRCFVPYDDKVMKELQTGAIVTLKGKVATKMSYGKIFRNMDVTSYRVHEAYSHEVISDHDFTKPNSPNLDKYPKDDELF